MLDRSESWRTSRRPAPRPSASTDKAIARADAARLVAPAAEHGNAERKHWSQEGRVLWCDRPDGFVVGDGLKVHACRFENRPLGEHGLQ
jgi:hypothetical protein